MEIVHKGFDGLDVAFEGQISRELDAVLAEAKAYATEQKCETHTIFNGVPLNVSQSGARGGYSYTCDTGVFGAIWFLKKPNPRDPWGVRVSVKSLPLAKYGLGWARHYIDDTLTKFGIETSHDKMSISRVDYAVDILAPAFCLYANCFVTHARTKRKTHDEIDHITTVGHSGRTTSVTVGSNPGRQVIIYDKREEVLNISNKVVWWDIWDANLAKMGKPPLDRTDPSKSRVWRVELRAFKRHLKDDWNLRTWADLDAMLHAIMTLMLSEIRYTHPSEDSNRSRWPDHAIWCLVRNEIEHELSEMASNVPATSLSAAIAMQKRNELLRLFLGIGTSLAGMERILPYEFSGFLDKITSEAISLSKEHKVPLRARLDKAAARYAFMQPDGVER